MLFLLGIPNKGRINSLRLHYQINKDKPIA